MNFFLARGLFAISPNISSYFSQPSLNKVDNGFRKKLYFQIAQPLLLWNYIKNRCLFLSRVSFFFQNIVKYEKKYWFHLYFFFNMKQNDICPQLYFASFSLLFCVVFFAPFLRYSLCAAQYLQCLRLDIEDRHLSLQQSKWSLTIIIIIIITIIVIIIIITIFIIILIIVIIKASFPSASRK